MSPGKRRAVSPEPRVGCLDAYRGFVILLMVFVNYLAGIGGMPAWLKHAPGGVDAYTIVDVVLPGFLFIVGAAIPLSLFRRRGSALGVALRIGRRVLSLLFLGVVMVSLERFSPEAAGMSRRAWVLLFFTGALLLWAAPHPGRRGAGRWIEPAVKVLAAALLVWLVVIFRQKLGDGSVVWLRTAWWGILGMIGWTYLAGCVAYLVTRGSATGLMGALGMAIAIYIAGRHGGLPEFLQPLDRYVSIGGLFGSHAAIVIAGILVGRLFTERGRTPASRMRFMAVFGLGLFAAGMLIRPLHGISKLGGTDAYALVTAGECCLGFLLFYWLMDVKGWRAWALPFSEAGRNALAAYILPSVVGAILHFTGTSGFFWRSWTGWTGAANAAVMTVLILLLTAGLTRLRIVVKV